jgi:Zinc finger, C3HC4 type (RING finger)
MQTRTNASVRRDARIRPRAFGQPSDTYPGRYGEVDDDFVARANRIVAQFGARPRLHDAIRAGVNSDSDESGLVSHGPLIVHGQVVRGDGLTIIGNSNSVYGNKCKVVGNSNNLTGDDGSVIGNHNIITGARCSVDGTNNIVVTEPAAPPPLRPVAPDYRAVDRARDRDRDQDRALYGFSEEQLFAQAIAEMIHPQLDAAYRAAAMLPVHAPRARAGTAFPVFPPGYEDAPSTDDDAPTTCTICSEHIRAVIAIPCGHFAMCGACCVKLKPEGRKDDAGLHMCPICQKGVSAFNRVFDS